MPTPGPGRYLFIILLITLTIAVAVVLNTNTTVIPPDGGSGMLIGNVSIGPLCPVEPCSISHEQIVAAYSARPIIITTDGGTFVGTATADPDTGYSIALRPGTYIVDIQHQGIGGSGDLPKTVVIRSGETVRLDISLDTGIR